MKIGFIFECGPRGADQQVCEFLAGMLRPDAQPVSRTLDNKANLLAQAALVTAALLRDGCERVLIVWDLRPAWPNTRPKPCRHDECAVLLSALAEAGIDQQQPVHWVCIEHELESWLLADHSKLGEYLSSPAHTYSVKRIRHPDREKQPKALLINHFKQAGRGRYDDNVHAIKVLQKKPLDVTKLRRSVSFARFEAKLTRR